MSLFSPPRWAPAFPAAGGAAGALGGAGAWPLPCRADKVPILRFSGTFFLRSFFPPSRGPAVVGGTTSPLTSLRANGRHGEHRHGAAPAARRAPVCRHRQRLGPGTGRTGSTGPQSPFGGAGGRGTPLGGKTPFPLFYWHGRPVPAALGFRLGGDADGTPRLWFVMNKRWPPSPRRSVGSAVAAPVKTTAVLGRFGLFRWCSLPSRWFRPSWPRHAGTGTPPVRTPWCHHTLAGISPRRGRGHRAGWGRGRWLRGPFPGRILAACLPPINPVPGRCRRGADAEAPENIQRCRGSLRLARLRLPRRPREAPLFSEDETPGRRFPPRPGSPVPLPSWSSQAASSRRRFGGRRWQKPRQDTSENGFASTPVPGLLVVGFSSGFWVGLLVLIRPGGCPRAAPALAVAAVRGGRAGVRGSPAAAPALAGHAGLFFKRYFTCYA
ncbi:nanos homolog 3 isoform X1 [Mycteria americana]|uniref:nanos homolog 3 isoform X1 n=1 Tax=Mycteria americana TaxID=33587 RepID=UPI003F58318C